MKANERVVRKVVSIFKKPHRAGGKLTLSERKFVEEAGVDGNELFNEKVPVEAEDVLELPKGEKKRVRLTVGVSTEEGRENKKSVKKTVHFGGGETYTLGERRSRGIREEDGDHLVTVRAGAYSRLEEDGSRLCHSCWRS